MSASPKIAVTPQRVADGDPVALTRLIERRAHAVVAFCETVCTYEVAPRAAAEAFARFRAAVFAAEDPRALDPEALLHGATRHAAAALARTASTDSKRRALGRRDDPLRCIPTPGLLAARLDHMLGAAEDDELAAHLRTCPGCRAVEARFNRAEQAYRRRPGGELDPATVLLILEALHDAAPVAGEFATEWADLLSPLQLAAEAIAEVPADEEDEEDDAEATVEFTPEAELEPEAETEREAEVDPEPRPAAQFGSVLIGGALSRARASRVPRPALKLRRPSLPRSLPRAPIASPAPLARGRELPRPFRHAGHEIGDHGLVYRYVLPGTALFVAALIILAVAGVFSAGGP